VLLDVLPERVEGIGVGEDGVVAIRRRVREGAAARRI
jgi:hypothetical protein